MHDILVILAAGASSRMKNSEASSDLNPSLIKEANSTSKALIGVGNKGRPFLDYLLLNAKKAGYCEIILVVGEHSEAFMNYYGSKKNTDSFKGLTIEYAIQYVPENRTKPMGTADALLQAMEQHPKLQNEEFTVCNSDNLYSVLALKLLRDEIHPNALISYDRNGLKYSMERIAKFALMIFDSENHLKHIIEKPTSSESSHYKDKEGHYRVSMNLFKFSGAHIYPFLQSCQFHPLRNEKELPSAIIDMIDASPKSMKGIPLKEHVPDLTSKDDILILKNYIEESET